MPPSSHNDTNPQPLATAGTIIANKDTRRAAILLAIEVLKEAHDALTSDSGAETESIPDSNVETESTFDSGHDVAAWIHGQTLADAYGTDESLPVPTPTSTPTPVNTTTRSSCAKRPATPRVPDNVGSRKVRRKILVGPGVSESDSQSDIVFLGMRQNSGMAKVAVGSPVTPKRGVGSPAIAPKARNKGKGPIPFEQPEA